jgi:hypothetical protein
VIAMASLRATKKSGRTSLNFDGGIEDTQISNGFDVMEISDDGPEEESVQSQSKSARELLTSMVAGVRTHAT